MVHNNDCFTTKIDKILSPFRLGEAQYNQVRDALDATMNLGLSVKGNAVSSIKMIPSYVTSLPNNEFGEFVALDLGGTNFRVLLIKLPYSYINGEVEMLSHIFEIPESVRYGNSDDLFDHIANCMEKFFDKYNINRSKEVNVSPIPLGFTFSFPCRQSGLNNAVLIEWTKDFKVEGVVGKDVVELLHKAIDKKKMNVRCFAVLNDTVGTLLSCAIDDRRTNIGLIIGTGTNAAYTEDVDKIETLDSESRRNNKMMIINTEWGAFGKNGELNTVLTEVDNAIDANSVNQGHQKFEKMISGFYMGEMVRLLLVNLAEEGCFSEAMNELKVKMRERQSFLTEYVSKISNDSDESFPKARSIMAQFGLESATVSDLDLVTRVCKVVSERAAKLVACGLGVLIDRVKSDSVVIGIDGSLYRYHDYFSKIMESSIQKFCKSKKTVKTKLSTDGSGKGAAVAASVAYKQLTERRN